MSHPDAYTTVVDSFSGEYREKGSKFIGVLMSCQSETELKNQVEQLRKSHPSASHVCFAALIPSERCSDDGEPNGTAGLPILNQLRSAGICNAAMFVVRYFGGTKLGKAGLIHAYKEAARNTLNAAEMTTKYRCSRLEFKFEYDATRAVMNALERIEHSTVLEQHFDQHCTILASIPLSEVDNALTLFAHINEVNVKVIDQ